MKLGIFTKYKPEYFVTHSLRLQISELVSINSINIEILLNSTERVYKCFENKNHAKNRAVISKNQLF